MLRPIRKLQLADRPFHASVSDDGRRFAACAPSGKFWLFDNDLRQLDEMDFGTAVTWIQLIGAEPFLLVGFKGHIEGFTTAGSITSIFRLPVRGTTGPCCAFNSDEYVLCVASWDRDPKLGAWNLETCTVVEEKSLPDRGGAGYMLVPHPEGEAMAVVAYSGQSEEWMFWVYYASGQLRIFTQPEIKDVALPCFHPTGREFVSFHERHGLCRMRFPSGELIATVQPEQAFPDNPEDTFSYDLHFLRDDRLLAWQYNLSLYEFDLATLRPISAVLTGVDGMTFGKDRFFSERSWQLAGSRLLTSDCQFGTTFQKRTDTLRLWDASELSGLLSIPDPLRPYTQQMLATG